MRRRTDGTAPPADLLTFDGRGYQTPEEWEAAFGEFNAARDRWCGERGLQDSALPIPKVVGECPWSDDWAIGPINSATHQALYRNDGSLQILRRRPIV